MEKLQKELDEALGVVNSDDPVTTFAQMKHLPYLEAVINEGMRIHATSGIGLPRVVPEGGLTVCGKSFPGGTIVSVPTYTVHRDPDVWGADADIFRPERWFERDPAKLQKYFLPFSFGPRHASFHDEVESLLTFSTQGLRRSKLGHDGIAHHHFVHFPSL